MNKQRRFKRLCLFESIYCANDWVQLLELLNKVWDLANWVCLLGVGAVRMNCCLRFGFGGVSVLVGKLLGYQVSCYTTVGVLVLLKDHAQLT
jgi:hypothetical protein